MENNLVITVDLQYILKFGNTISIYNLENSDLLVSYYKHKENQFVKASGNETKIMNEDEVREDIMKFVNSYKVAVVIPNIILTAFNNKGDVKGVGDRGHTK